MTGEAPVTPAADSDSPPARGGMSRRSLLTGGAGVVLGAAAAGAVAVTVWPASDPVVSPAPGASPGASAEPGQPVVAEGAHQAGVARPEVPQTHALVAVFDAPTATAAGLAGTLAAIGDEIAAMTRPGGTTEATPDGPGDLTVAVGLGPRLLGMIDPALAATAELPAFARDADLDPVTAGGDVLLFVSATDAGVLEPVTAALAATGALVPRWRQPGFRGAVSGVAPRNPLGFHDGIIVPRTAEELDDGVWIADGALAGGTICVLRRLVIDLSAFRGLDTAAQEAVIGRSKSDGAPLSGGEPDDQIDLLAKSPDGAYLVPARAHARAAHPSFTGSPLMLRRSYSYANADADRGLMFISFQNDVDTYVKTQQRMDETDDLMPYTTTTASAAFAMLPGFTPAAPLGSTLSA